jgi:hypothetical protein
MKYGEIETIQDDGWGEVAGGQVRQAKLTCSQRLTNQ